MSEKMDFFEAARQSERNGSRIKFKAEEWRHWHDYFARGNIFLPEQLLEKVWEVEPELVELFDFDIAFAAARRGDLIAPEGSEDWSTYEVDLEEGAAYFAKQAPARGCWWPNKTQIEGKWRIKPKEEKEIFVWGVCDSDGESYIFENKPSRHASGTWDVGINDQNIIEIYAPNLFPKDKPQKFKLVPVDDNE